MRMTSLKYCSGQRLLGEAILFYTQQQLYQVLVEEIDYLESDRRKIRVHLEEEEEISVYGTLAEMEKMLDPCFCRCSGSALVNLQNVRKLERMKFFMRSGKSVEIGQRYYAEVRQKFCLYVNRRGSR